MVKNRDITISKRELDFLNAYWDIYKKLLFQSRNDKALINAKNLIKNVEYNGGKVIFVGNGASASLSSHAATDLTKQGKIKSISFNDHNLITALSNDYGYENWVAKALEYYAETKDLLVLISVSGESPNLVNAVKYANNVSIDTLCITGFDKENSLNSLTKNSLWVDSKSYNIVESIHTIWITLIIDLIVGKSNYSVN